MTVKGKIAAFCLAAILLVSAACADTWEGSVTAAETVTLNAPAAGILTELTLEVGQTVTAGMTAGETAQTAVFAPADGSIAAVHAKAGEKVSGTVLEISPTSQYLVTCTTSNVAKTVENALIHMGETVYMKCTVDGSHRAVGTVVSIDNTTYEVEVIGGELYVGEAVYVYRDAALSTGRLLGKGTVTSHETLAVAGEGRLLTMRAEAGRNVAKGQLLFTTATTEETALIIPADGVVTQLKAAKGANVQEDQAVADIAVGTALRIQVTADEAARFHVGGVWYYTRSDDPHENSFTAKVSRIFVSEEDASATIELIPDGQTELPIGLTIHVTDEPGG